MKLHLGVIDVPYQTGGVTTGDVAEFLEAKYGILDQFQAHHLQDVANVMADGVAGAIENLVMGGPALDPFAGAASKTETMMKKFVTDREIEGLGIPGVPTQAALEGKNSRLKIKRGARRPSFLDTTLMVDSYKAWVEE